MKNEMKIKDLEEEIEHLKELIKSLDYELKYIDQINTNEVVTYSKNQLIDKKINY